MLPHDYSWSERALGFWSTLMLAVLAVASLALRYVTDPISCWTPAQFEESQVRYTERFCFQEQFNYYDMPEGEVPERIVGNIKPQYSYHHWVPFALGIAAFVCVIPHVLWRLLSGLLWMNTHSLVQIIADNQRQNPAGRHVMLRDCALVVQAGLKGGNCMLCVTTMGRKVLACITCVTQVVLAMAVFRPALTAETEDKSSGEEDGSNASRPIPLPEGAFRCYFEIRHLTNVHQYEVQCTLPLSPVFNKGFTILTYFFLLLALCSATDLLIWACRVFIPVLRDISLQRYLTVVEQGSSTSATVQHFLTSLGPDGRLLLAVTADHCGPVAAADLTNHLCNAFKGTSRPGPPDPASIGSSPMTHGSASASSAPSADPAARSAENTDVMPLLSMAGRGHTMETKPV